MKNPKTSYIFNKNISLPIICSKCGSIDEKLCKQKNIK